MKCYHCNDREADNRFFVNYMGHLGEIYLCSECMETIWRQFSGMMQGMQPEQQGMAWPGAPMQMPQTERDAFPQDAGHAIRLRRKENELRAQLMEAVRQEDYERAARLRDEINQVKEDVCIHDS